MKALCLGTRKLGLNLGAVALCALAGVVPLTAQTCLTAEDMEPATKTALLNTAQNFFELIARGDSATLRQNSIPSLAENFSGIELAIKDSASNFSAAKPAARPPFLLQVDSQSTSGHDEFLCGVFGPSGQTADSVVFNLSNLQPGSYAVVIQDVSSGNGPHTVAYVLAQQANSWKLGGLYVKPEEAAGHDGRWFGDRAREYKASGNNLVAWLYYQQARELLVPVSFMSTMLTDKLYDESQTVKPADLPPSDLTVGGKTLKLTALFSLPVGNELDLVVKYESPSVANTAQTYQDNIAVIKALLAKHPELRGAFSAMIARAVEPSGRDYGTMQAMKDVK